MGAAGRPMGRTLEKAREREGREMGQGKIWPIAHGGFLLFYFPILYY